jgi:hypothetical protein
MHNFRRFCPKHRFFLKYTPYTFSTRGFSIDHALRAQAFTSTCFSYCRIAKARVTREPMPAMFSSISHISTSIQQSVEDPLHVSYKEMDDEKEGDEDIADDRSDSSWTNGKDIFTQCCGSVTSKFFCLLLSESTFTSFFKDK